MQDKDEERKSNENETKENIDSTENAKNDSIDLAEAQHEAFQELRKQDGVNAVDDSQAFIDAVLEGKDLDDKNDNNGKDSNDDKSEEKPVRHWDDILKRNKSKKDKSDNDKDINRNIIGDKDAPWPRTPEEREKLYYVLHFTSMLIWFMIAALILNQLAIGLSLGRQGAIINDENSEYVSSDSTLRLAGEKADKKEIENIAKAVYEAHIKPTDVLTNVIGLTYKIEESSKKIAGYRNKLEDYIVGQIQNKLPAEPKRTIKVQTVQYSVTAPDGNKYTIPTEERIPSVYSLDGIQTSNNNRIWLWVRMPKDNIIDVVVYEAHKHDDMLISDIVDKSYRDGEEKPENVEYAILFRMTDNGIMRYSIGDTEYYEFGYDTEEEIKRAIVDSGEHTYDVCMEYINRIINTGISFDTLWESGSYGKSAKTNDDNKATTDDKDDNNGKADNETSEEKASTLSTFDPAGVKSPASIKSSTNTAGVRLAFETSGYGYSEDVKADLAKRIAFMGIDISAGFKYDLYNRALSHLVYNEDEYIIGDFEPGNQLKLMVNCDYLRTDNKPWIDIAVYTGDLAYSRHQKTVEAYEVSYEGMKHSSEAEGVIARIKSDKTEIYRFKCFADDDVVDTFELMETIDNTNKRTA